MPPPSWVVSLISENAIMLPKMKFKTTFTQVHTIASPTGRPKSAAYNQKWTLKTKDNFSS